MPKVTFSLLSIWKLYQIATCNMKVFFYSDENAKNY